MLSQNAEVCSVFEFFSGIDTFFRFRTDEVGGEELATRLCEDHPMQTMVLKRGYKVPEVAYPFDDPTSRYNTADPIPWTCAIAVARLTDEPDRVFEELLDVARHQPAQTLARHYRALLDWLTQRTGHGFWIEKSGTSLEFAEELKQFFPDARFVYLHRDAYETALSMREYDVLRLAVPVMNGLLGEVEYSHAGLLEFERKNGDAIDRTLASQPPIELFGQYWNGQIERGLPALATVDRADILGVRFEELVTEPVAVLRQIAEFFEIPTGGANDGWIARAAALVKGLPPRRFESLDPEAQRALELACAEGLELEGRFEAELGRVD
jgi:hypothetical protein